MTPFERRDLLWLGCVAVVGLVLLAVLAWKLG